MNRLILFLPAYNEAESLPLLLPDIQKTIESQGYQAKIFVINDGSSDATSEIAKSFAPKLPLEVVDVIPNQGLANAMRTGFQKALQFGQKGDVIVAMDADHSHKPAQIPQLLEKISAGADLVIASRFQAGAEIHGLTSFRKFLSWGAGMLFRVFVRIKGARDYTCGYRAYTWELIQHADQTYGTAFISREGFESMAEILIKLGRAGAKVAEIPMILRYDDKQSSSKMNIWKTIKGTLSLVFS